MDSVQREMKGLIEEVDGILYYDEVKLQEGIEREMTEKGLKVGFEQGKKEKSLEIAKKLLDLDVSVDKIINSTGLTLEEIEKLN